MLFVIIVLFFILELVFVLSFSFMRLLLSISFCLFLAGCAGSLVGWRSQFKPMRLRSIYTYKKFGTNIYYKLKKIKKMKKELIQKYLVECYTDISYHREQIERLQANARSLKKMWLKLKYPLPYDF